MKKILTTATAVILMSTTAHATTWSLDKTQAWLDSANDIADIASNAGLDGDAFFDAFVSEMYTGVYNTGYGAGEQSVIDTVNAVSNTDFGTVETQLPSVDDIKTEDDLADEIDYTATGVQTLDTSTQYTLTDWMADTGITDIDLNSESNRPDLTLSSDDYEIIYSEVYTIEYPGSPTQQVNQYMIRHIDYTNTDIHDGNLHGVGIGYFETYGTNPTSAGNGGIMYYNYYINSPETILSASTNIGTTGTIYCGYCNQSVITVYGSTVQIQATVNENSHTYNLGSELSADFAPAVMDRLEEVIEEVAADFYQSGYEDGYYDGYADGFEDGYAQGYADGFSDGVQSVKDAVN